MASNNERGVIETEIISLKRVLDKYNKDYLIVTSMIDNLIDDRIGISKESMQLMEMIEDREKALEKMGEV